MTETTNTGNAAATPRFDLDIEVDPTNGVGGDGFVTGAEMNGAVEVKRSTYIAKMPFVFGTGTLMKRLATIILPRNKRIAILPHTVSTYDKITDHEDVPTDQAGILNYIFDAREWTMHRGLKTERRMIEFKFQVESPITVTQIKQAPKVLELLKKHQIYLFGKRYMPAVTTQPAGLLMNIDARKCSQVHLIEAFTLMAEDKLNIKVFIDVVPHRASVRVGKKAIWGDFLKVMVEAEHMNAVAKLIQTSLRNKEMNKRFDNVRLMPCHPMRNMMTTETFRDMIFTHNKTMYDIAEVQVNNVWDIDTEIKPNKVLREKLGLDGYPEDELFSFKDILIKVFNDQWEESKVTDAYLQRGRLNIVCSKAAVEEATIITDRFIEFMKEHFDEGDDSASKFAEWLGCNTPNNESRHPARSGTLIYGEERVLKATVNSFMDKNLSALVEGIVPVAGMAASKPDLARPPRVAMTNRSRRVVHVDPNEFHPSAVAAWSTANAWAAADAPRVIKAAIQKRNQKKQTPREVVTVDDGTVSTGLLSTTTQAALTRMTETLEKFEENEKKNQTRISSLDATIAQIANSVAKITESQDRITKGHVALQEAMIKMAKANEETKRMLQEFTSRPAQAQAQAQVQVQATTIISEDTEMESSLAGKRGADAISTVGSGRVTRSMTHQQASGSTNSQTGVTLPCTSFLTGSDISDSTMRASPTNSSEDHGAGRE